MASGSRSASRYVTESDPDLDSPDRPRALAKRIRHWARELGFQRIGITDIDLASAESRLRDWVRRGYHGEMTYMTRHGKRRSRPAELVPDTLRIISVRMDYLPPPGQAAWSVLQDARLGYVSRYALGRDYHKLIRKRLQRLADRMQQSWGPFGYRAFCDSAPVMEKPLAEKAGLGWIGKHSNLLSRDSGSWFFLGELYTDLPLPVDPPAANHCGRCRSCIDICPTQAIVAPYVVDARRCISYLTIELRGAIPVPLRAAMGNRIYGCDDCQLVCPWNRFAVATAEKDFLPRHGLDATPLHVLFGWDETTFLRNTEGSAIRRIGHIGWLRNIAVALGNGPGDAEDLVALRSRIHYPHPMVREHVTWALSQHAGRDQRRPGARV